MARDQETALARFYGLPNVHTEGVPPRHIVSLKGTPTYGRAKWPFRRLRFLSADSDTTVCSSKQFLEKLKGVSYLPNEVMVSFEVTSLLTSIPHDLAIETFQLILRNKYNETENRLGQLNAVFPDIQFTMEEEENNQLAFLDVLVCRKDCGGLKTKVFRKATNTTQILNFNNNHPISHKRSCVRALYRRVETYCSETEDRVAEFQNLRQVFKENVHPRNFVSRCMRKRDEGQNRTDPKFLRAIPYIKNVAEAVSRLLAPLGVGVAQRPEATMRRQVIRPKDPLPRHEASRVVYCIWCSCGHSNYVGESGRLIRTRIAERAAAVRRNDANSQVAVYSRRPRLTFKFDVTEIIARGDNRVSRELLESWFTGPQSKSATHAHSILCAEA
nr:unnamed protein product [Spirometra erinaceieuropaei]